MTIHKEECRFADGHCLIHSAQSDPQSVSQYGAQAALCIVGQAALEAQVAALTPDEDEPALAYKPGGEFSGIVMGERLYETGEVVRHIRALLARVRELEALASDVRRLLENRENVAYYGESSDFYVDCENLQEDITRLGESRD